MYHAGRRKGDTVYPSHICKMGDTQFDRLLRCSVCGVYVHQYCYGVSEAKPMWKCYTCAQNIQYPMCCICKMVGNDLNVLKCRQRWICVCSATEMSGAMFFVPSSLCGLVLSTIRMC